jgi:hypothetical protein
MIQILQVVVVVLHLQEDEMLEAAEELLAFLVAL